MLICYFCAFFFFSPVIDRKKDQKTCLSVKNRFRCTRLLVKIHNTCLLNARSPAKNEISCHEPLPQLVLRFRILPSPIPILSIPSSASSDGPCCSNPTSSWPRTRRNPIQVRSTVPGKDFDDLDLVSVCWQVVELWNRTCTKLSK